LCISSREVNGDGSSGRSHGWVRTHINLELPKSSRGDGELRTTEPLVTHPDRILCCFRRDHTASPYQITTARAWG